MAAQTAPTPALPPITSRFYTGVGATQLPTDIEALIVLVASYLASTGLTVRTGTDKGTDAAFARAAGQTREVFAPHSGASGYGDALVVQEPDLLHQASAIAATVHPDWQSYNDFARRAHTRRVFQLLGATLDCPSAYVLCYVPIATDGSALGSARTVIALAQARHIPVWNLQDLATRNKFRQRLGELQLLNGQQAAC